MKRLYRKAFRILIDIQELINPTSLSLEILTDRSQLYHSEIFLKWGREGRVENQSKLIRSKWTHSGLICYMVFIQSHKKLIFFSYCEIFLCLTYFPLKKKEEVKLWLWHWYKISSTWFLFSLLTRGLVRCYNQFKW